MKLGGKMLMVLTVVSVSILLWHIINILSVIVLVVMRVIILQTHCQADGIGITPLSPGSIAVWGSYANVNSGYNTGKYGHVGLVYAVSGNTIYTVETNLGSSSGGSDAYARFRERPAGNVTTYIHPDFNQYVNLGDDFYAYIIQKSDWKHLEASNGNVQIASNGNDSYDPKQIWYFIRTSSDNHYKIINEYNGQCLDATNSGTENGTNVGVCDSNDSTAQRWYIGKSIMGAFTICPSYASNLVLDCTNGYTNSGTNIQLYTSNETSAQEFDIYDISSDGWTYNKPSVPPSSSITSVSYDSMLQLAIINWSNSALTGKLDNRVYDIRIWKGTDTSVDPCYGKMSISGTQHKVNLSEGTYTINIATVNTKYYQCYTMGSNITCTLNINHATNTIHLWACGFENKEGNSNSGHARLLGTKSFDKYYGDEFVLTENDCTISIPNGFYLKNKIGSGYTGEWVMYDFGTTFSQPDKGINFEYDCYPIDYSITYNLNGGINSANNPSTYNVLYGVTLKDPTREGYTFAGWTDANGNKVTGINPGANADHSSAEELYSMLSTRTTGDQTLTANWIHDCANSLTWSDWTVTKAPTTSETGVESRYCSVCGEAETRELPVLIIPEVTTDNYVVTITLASDITAMRYAGGEHTTAGSIKSAPDRVDISESVIAKNTVDGRFVYTMPDGGYYTFWVRMKDGNEYLLAADMTEFIPSVDTYGVMVTVNDLYDIKDCFIAKGEFNNYNEIKNNGYIVRLTANKIAGKHSYTYTVTEPGMHTILVRYNDGSEYIFHEELTVDEPVFTTNGLQVTVSNIPGVKVIRTAYGEYYTPGDTKRAEGARNFSNKSVIKDAEEYMLQYREEGRVTIIVEYNNGYVKVFHYDVTKKTPTIEQNGNTVSFSDLDGLVMVRYAEGIYSTSSEIKKAKGSKVIKPDAIADGKISVTDLAVGTYTFCVQYDDDSYNYYTVTVE